MNGNITYYYEPESLADVPVALFEAELAEAFEGKFPGALVEIRQGHGRTWGETKGGQGIPPDRIREVANDVFERICRKLAAEEF